MCVSWTSTPVDVYSVALFLPFLRSKRSSRLCKSQIEAKELEAMLHRETDLRARVWRLLKHWAEGHHNAIQVFTFFTVLFQPLFFVTSFFGMTTADLRDMPQRSWLYWAIKAPGDLARKPSCSLDLKSIDCLDGPSFQTSAR
ncbi:hypothetical protein Cob_v013207 [Colletotrichum orbiculare MAFF 240422]|uniref:Uncharacterized protein n=1 Tax=Colletotrichum orbiculare (strain 104-T / ATCC 96160 / CBS 514.97 / LARS 414 / MAFF 240422) TaxID=1213857 RepID=A0A484F6G5_COLOR|nr:hypothetical protein Cob_v013207 [Colletotrichum orbiculare MAFF 240422]